MASAPHPVLADSDGVEEEAEWFSGPSLLRNTAAERYVAKWQVLRSVAEGGVAWDFEVPFQPFTDRSLNEQVLGPFHSGLFRAGDFDWRLRFAVAFEGSGTAALSVTLVNAHAEVALPHWQCEVAFTMEIVVPERKQQLRMAGERVLEIFSDEGRTPSVKPQKLTLKAKRDDDDLGSNTKSPKLVAPLASVQSACFERRFGSFVGSFFTVRARLNAGRTLDSDAAKRLSSVNVAAEFEHPIRKRERQHREMLAEILRLKAVAKGKHQSLSLHPILPPRVVHSVPESDCETESSGPMGWQN
ncbi:hypothetical protein DIPPA_14628 [Diplonema papillatum]|nr:hypothetical protein DIPPA_14628 [Diplonema papillatum]